MDDPTPFPSTIDHFRVIAVLGKWGMGVVYRAEDLLLHRPVALKVMRAEQVADPQRRARFLREARTAASFVHPNVATIYEVGEADGAIFIAMELVPGASLRELLTRGPLEATRVHRWALGIARALARAHEMGIVHRDLKPDNVMVLPDDEVKLLDFGIAKALAADTGDAGAPNETMTQEGSILGTPPYVSPEQARSERLDVRSDVFSFGTMLFEMLTGVSPFLRATALDTLAAVVRDPSPSLRELAPRVSPELEAVVARCLEKAPHARFPSGVALLAAIEGTVTRRSPSAPPLAMAKTELEAKAVSVSPVASTRGDLPPVTRPPAPRSRPPAVWALVALAATCALATTGALLVRASRHHAPTPPPAIASDPPCTSNAACAREHHGAWKCNQARHACVEIASADCTVLADPADLEAEDTVWIGKLLPTTGPMGQNLLGESRAVDLARKDFTDTLRGSMATGGDLHARPMAIVSCDEVADPLRAAHHLADDVEVPAVIGFFRSETALSAIPSVFLPRHVLSFVSISQSSELTKIPQPDGEERLVWQSTYNHAGTARALAALVTDVLEPRARATGFGGTFRVAIVSANSRGRDFDDAFFRDLQFNGKSALENGNDYRQYLFDEHGADAATVAQNLADFAPNVVVAKGSGFSALLPRLERAWHRPWRPTYLTVGGFDDDAFHFAGADASRRRRFLSVTNVTTTLPNAELVLHYNATYPDAPIERSEAPQPSYDAAYLIGYAAQAAPSGPLDGLMLSRELALLLPPGTPIQVGLHGILPAFKTLKTGGRVDLTGALGDLDFDPKTGEAPVDFEVLCPGVDDHGAAKDNVDSGLVFASKRGTFRGAMKCP